MKQILLALTIIFLCTKIGFAQVNKPIDKDKINLRNFTSLEGKILEVNKRWVVIKIGSVPFSINKRKILSIYYNGEEISLLTDAELIEFENERMGVVKHVPKEKMVKTGFYNVTYGALHFLESTISFQSGVIDKRGFGVENIVGYQFNQFSSLGLGLGYHSSGVFNEVKLIPIYAEYRGYITQKKVSPYYSLAFGALMAAKNENSTFDSSKPGSYFYPAFGFKTGNKDSSFMVDIGLRFGSLTLGKVNSRDEFREEKEVYKGVVLRIGLLL